MPDSENAAQNINNQEIVPSGDVKYITIGNTTYEVVSNYAGNNSLLDVIKSAIKRDIETGS